MHKGDRVRFLREECGDIFCFVNKSDVKTLIGITKYSPNVNKILLKYTSSYHFGIFHTVNVYLPSLCTRCYRNGR